MSKPDLSRSDFAAIERQHAWFAELHSKIGDNRDQEDGNIIVGLRWALVLTIIIAAGIGFYWYFA